MSTDQFVPERDSQLRAIGALGTGARALVGVVFVMLGLLLRGDGIEWTALVLGVAAFPAILGAAQLLRVFVIKAQLRATGPVAFLINLAVLTILLATPATSHPTFVFLGVSMLVAAWRGYAGCESLAISNWILRRNDQVGCLLFWPVDELETRLRTTPSSPSRSATESAREWLPGLLIVKLAGCAILAALLVYLAQ